MKQKIAIGSDHAGYRMKEEVKALLQGMGIEATDYGTHSTDSTDYPDFAHPVANAVEKGQSELGILICGSANGVAMTANKHQGIRAAICWNEELAALARQHNNANVLCLPARFIDKGLAEKIVGRFLQAH
ncbi:MAG TPA: ribose 5-phosphate isomerase B, partial [Cyclobacteriaceae bacterium]|nr:ribose 5-phosphate isomerase B [Cyclobacteriaceae bacterium]